MHTMVCTMRVYYEYESRAWNDHALLSLWGDHVGSFLYNVSLGYQRTTLCQIA